MGQQEAQVAKKKKMIVPSFEQRGPELAMLLQEVLRHALQAKARLDVESGREEKKWAGGVWEGAGDQGKTEVLREKRSAAKAKGYKRFGDCRTVKVKKTSGAREMEQGDTTL